MSKTHTWNLSYLQSDDSSDISNKILDECNKASYDFINKWKDRTDYLEDPDILNQALSDYEKWSRLYGASGSTGYYYLLRSQQEQNNTEIKAQLSKIHDQEVKIQNDIQFFEHKLSKISVDQQKEFLNSVELKEYHHFLEQLFNEAKYLLSENEEKILTLKSKAAYSNWVKMVSEAYSKEEDEVIDDNGEKKLKTLTEITSLLSSVKKEVRVSAAKSYYKILNKYLYLAENEINSILYDKKVNDQLRRFDRPDKARHISDDIDSEVVDALVESVSSAYKTAKEYYKLKANLLGVEKLKHYERNVPIGEIEKEYTFDDSVDLVRDVFSNLDESFLYIFDEFVKNGQLDVFPRKNKSGGAFCINVGKNYPTYVLLNHTNKFQDVLTMAHEMGHGINDTLINDNQNELNTGNSLAIAEVASTFMEDFVLEKLKREADEEMTLNLNMMKLNEDISTIHRQVACYKFEWDLHLSFREKGYLSPEQIAEIYVRNMESYMGSAVEKTPGSENGWALWSHIRTFFYVYSYASGLLISKSLQHSVKEDPGFIERVKVIMSQGTSKSPKDIFIDAGIDITDRGFWKKGLTEVDSLLEETKILAKKLNRI